MKFTQTILATALLCAGPASASSFHLVVPLTASPGAHKPDANTLIQVSLASAAGYQATVGTPVAWDISTGLTISNDEDPQPQQAIYSIASGSLLPGLALTPDGVVNGVTTASGQSTASVEVTYKGKKAYANLVAASAWQPVDFTGLMSAFNRSVVELPGATWTATGSPYYWRSIFGLSGGSLAGNYQFRKVLENDSGEPVTVKIRGVVDDILGAMSLNGSPVHLPEPWAYNSLTDSPELVLLPGKNVIGVSVENRLNASSGLTNSAGFSLPVFKLDGTRYDTDGGWMAQPGHDVLLRSATIPAQYLWEASNINLRGLLSIDDTAGPVVASQISWAILDGALPAGLSLNTSTGVISGAASEFVTNKLVTVQATYKGSSVKRSYSITTGYKMVDYSALMSGFAAAAHYLTPHTAWTATGAGWYWNTANAQQGAAPISVEFRKIIDNNTGVPMNVQFFGAIDNEMRGMSINGIPVRYNPSWGFGGSDSAEVFSLPPGRNVVSIIVHNAGDVPNPAGFSLLVRNTSGTRIDTEGGWYSR